MVATGESPWKIHAVHDDSIDPYQGYGEALGAARAAIDHLRSLLDEIDPLDADPNEFLELMARAGQSLHRFDIATQHAGGAIGLSSAKERMRAYFLSHVGEVVTTYEINGVSGIQESPRRIRELRVDEGMEISAGPTSDLANGEYRLEATERELNRAAQWRRHNSIRRTGGSVRDRCLLLLRAVYPEAASLEDLEYVAKNQEWRQTISELEDEGWEVIESASNLSPQAVSYRLGSLERSPARSLDN
jgi:hypothetical protein